MQIFSQQVKKIVKRKLKCSTITPFLRKRLETWQNQYGKRQTKPPIYFTVKWAP